MSHSDMPTHVEGYPSLDIHKAMTAGNPMEVVCIYTNERGQRVGFLFVEQWEPTSVLVHFELIGRYFPWGSGPLRLETETVAGYRNPQRRYFRCHGCDRRAAILVYRGHWSCRRCHGLVYRSQLLPKGVSDWERLDRLKARVKMGRKHRMRNVTFQNLKAEHDELEKRLQKREWASERQRQVIAAEWVADDPFKYLHKPNFFSQVGVTQPPEANSRGTAMDFSSWDVPDL